ncbi:MAG: FxLYD domain-containing protein [Candidatus Altiarchaeota archaeon]
MMERVMMAILSAALFFGCLSEGSPADGNVDVSQTIINVSPTTTVAPSVTETTTTVTATTTTLDSTTTLLATTTSLVFDYDSLTVMIAGCDDDYYHNAMIGGYVTNNGDRTIPNVDVVVYLEDSDGQVLDGVGERIMVESLKPGERRQFKATIIKPGSWSKCRAEAKPPGE